MSDLQKLAQNREALLLAEVAGWLHDVGKLTVQHLECQLQGRTFSWPNDMAYKIVLKRANEIINFSKGIDSFRKPDIVNAAKNEVSPVAADFLPDKLIEFLQDTKLSIYSETYTLGELITLGTPGFATNQHRSDLLAGKDGWLPAVLGICHHIAHHDKPELPKDEGSQNYPHIYSSSALGYEILHVSLDNHIEWLKRRDILAREMTFNDSTFRKTFAMLLKLGLGDTRWPNNEILLDDWGSTVAALFKSGIAAFLLTEKKASIGTWKSWKDKIIDFNIKWRLLNFRTDGLSFLFSAPSIPDLLSRKSILTDGLNRVQTLLEDTYPLGLEVYRDESGSLFVVPDIENLEFSLTDSACKKSLWELMLEAFGSGTVKNEWCLRIDGEVLPEITGSMAWDGQPPTGLPPVGKYLQQETGLKSDIKRFADEWCHQQEQVCASCGLRPRGPSKKAKGRSVCDVCERRRADRSKEWALSKLDTTIWTNEVADINGRLALIVGQFDLTHWLDGTLIQSMTVTAPPSSSRDNITKNPSFARVRRIWETTRLFWQNRLTADTFSQAGPRLEIIPANADHLDLGHYHVYDLVLTAGSKLSVVWDEKNKRFITAENLEYLGKPEQLGESVKIWLADRRGQHLILEEPTGYGSANKEWGKIEIQDVREIPNSSYIPAIPILAEPRTFMALVPANKALDVVRGIKTKYEREMGKVRNRLPLHLGIVYAHRRTPLRTVLDAGRRMLQQNALVVDAWRVDEVRREQTGPLPPKTQVLSDGTQQFNKWHAIKLKNTKLNCSLTWYVPAVMGDGETEDHWYPYVYLNSQSEPSDRQRYFKTPNPWTGKNGWLVHAGELKNGDQIYFTPATLDFQWLDTAGRRFEIAYDESGKRLRSLTKPYLLDELNTLNDMWATLSNHLSKNQIYAIRDEIELKREAWQPSPEDCQKDGMFRKFCLDILANAAWQKFKGSYPWGNESLPAQGWLDTWADYAARGWLNDVVELHLQIMKEKMHTENREGVLS